MPVPNGGRAAVPAGRRSVSRVPTSSGVPSSMGGALFVAGEGAGTSGSPSWGKRAGKRTGSFFQSTKSGCEISYSTVNGSCVAYGSDAHEPFTVEYEI